MTFPIIDMSSASDDICAERFAAMHSDNAAIAAVISALPTTVNGAAIAPSANIDLAQRIITALRALDARERAAAVEFHQVGVIGADGQILDHSEMAFMDLYDDDRPVWTETA